MPTHLGYLSRALILNQKGTNNKHVTNGRILPYLWSFKPSFMKINVNLQLATEKLERGQAHALSHRQSLG